MKKDQMQSSLSYQKRTNAIAIYLNKGKYRESGEDTLNVINMSSYHEIITTYNLM